MEYCCWPLGTSLAASGFVDRCRVLPATVIFRFGVHRWRSTLYFNTIVAVVGATGTGLDFGCGLRKCHPARAAMTTAAPAAIGIHGGFVAATGELVAICALCAGGGTARALGGATAFTGAGGAVGATSGAGRATAAGGAGGAEFSTSARMPLAWRPATRAGMIMGIWSART